MKIRPPKIRPLAMPADRAGLRALLRRCADYALLERGRAYDAADLADVLADALDGGEIGPGRRWAVEGPDGRLDGMAVLEFGFPAPRDAYVGLLLLAPEARRQGQGAALVATMAGTAAALGCDAIHAAVLDANPGAAAFWARQGFAAVHIAPEAAIGLRRHVYHRLRRALP